MVEAGHVLVIMEPEFRTTMLRGSETVTTRYRLTKVNEIWRIDLKEECTDAVHFRKVSL